jgi:hypothetical protein
VNIKNLWTAIILLAVFGMHRYAQQCGVGKTYDSENYVWASNTYTERGVLENRDGVPFLQQPPLFPVVLSFAKPYQVAWSSWLNTACLVGTVWLWLLLAGKVWGNTIVWYFYGGFLAFAMPLYLVHQFLWSEPLFLLLVSLHFIILERYERTKKTIFWWLLVVVAWLFCLQRSIGIVFVLGTAGAYLWAGKGRNIAMWLYLLMASSGFLVWLICVLYVRLPTEVVATYGLQDDAWAGISMCTESLGRWFLPTQASAWGVWVVLAVILIFKRRIFVFKDSVWASLGLSTGLYILVLCLKKSDFSDTERFVAVLYPVFLLGIFSTLPTQNTKIAVLCLCLLWIYPTVRCVKNVVFWKEVSCKK